MARTWRLQLEVLEDRSLPANFGLPWLDPQRITLSFVPDGTKIQEAESTLFQTLDAQMPRDTWQTAILKAVQAWTRVANISVSVANDEGQPFGSAGLSFGDPRFGDIRIGAQPLGPEVLAVSIPPDPFLSGTWSGDIFVNSDYDFAQAHNDLFSVMLHEVGHVLGLEENDDPTSVMYDKLPAVPNQGLSAADVLAVQSLYGIAGPAAKPGKSLASATPIVHPVKSDGGGFDGETPLVLWQRITTPGESHFYSVRMVRDYVQAVTFRVQSTGMSLLRPQLSIYDARGKLLSQAAAADITGSTLSVRLDKVQKNSLYYIKVEAAALDGFDHGRYALAVIFEKKLSIKPQNIDVVLGGKFDSLSAQALMKVFEEPNKSLVDDEEDANNELTQASVLETTPGFPPAWHYQTIGSLAGASDVDFYAIRAPTSDNAAPATLTVTLRAFSNQGGLPLLEILDESGQVLAADVLVQDDQTLTLQAGNLTSGGQYYLRLSAPNNVPGEQEEPEDDTLKGNYGVYASFVLPSNPLVTFADGALADTAAELAGTFYVAHAQLYHFVLGATLPAGSTSSVKFTITDLKGNVLFELDADAAGGVSSAAILLAPGEYKVKISASSPEPGEAVGPIGYLLRGTPLGDPVGPALINPNYKPTYQKPSDPTNYYYPNGVVSVTPYWLGFGL